MSWKFWKKEVPAEREKEKDKGPEIKLPLPQEDKTVSEEIKPEVEVKETARPQKAEVSAGLPAAGRTAVEAAPVEKAVLPEKKEPKVEPKDEKPRQTDEELEAELMKIAPELMAQAKTPESRRRIVELARKMKSDGVDIKSTKQVNSWLKKNPDAVSNEPAQKVETYVRPEPKVGRNDPCSCGSGKKYKKCCGK